MKPTSSKDNTLEVLIFVIIFIVAVALTYGGSPAFPDAVHSPIWERILSVPMMATIYVISPELSPGYVVLGWVGSIVFYFWLGTMVLITVQNWIHAGRKKRGGGGGTTI